MEFIEVSAKTVDEALTEASISLGIPSSEIEYEVVEKGSTGFLGLGSKNAVIKARKKFSAEENVKEFLCNTLRLRPDYNNYLLRFGKIKEYKVEKIKYQGKRNKFDLTIDNDEFKRYSGEVNLVIEELPHEDRINILGSVKCSDLIVKNIKKKGFVKLNVKK